MSKRSWRFLPLFCAICILGITSCKNSRKKRGDNIAQSLQEFQQKAADFIQSYLEDAEESKGMLEDSTQLNQFPVVQQLYEKAGFVPQWSSKEQWKPLGDSLYHFIVNAQLCGLFPEDYHEKQLTAIWTLFHNDSNAKKERKDIALWSRAELMLTDAFVQIVKDIKLGRLPQDSITLRKDSILADEFYYQQFAELQRSGSLAQMVALLEPKLRGYNLLKAGIPKFLDSADYRPFTLIPATKDPVAFKRALQKRLFEGGYIASDSVMVDSAQLAEAIRKFQRSKNIAVDGKAGEGTVRMLNTSDREKFIRIAISMDKYKMLPDTMPEKYIWVNLPAYHLEVIDDDTVRLFSKVICGKVKTRTPVLSSAVSEVITYPQWVPPPSIIQKEILPAVKKNPGYLAKKGFSLVDSKGDEVDPYTVDWSKYSKGIPYRVVQGSGDANSLGIMKFNFSNKYSVYLHDTNQRYLFGQTTRSLSHGCVRVQEWQKLATLIITDDRYKQTGSGAVLDSMSTWLQKKQKHNIAVRNKFPLFIRYFTCEGGKDGIVFYDDIYGEDKMLRERYFASK